MANAMESLFSGSYHSVVVNDVQYYNEQLKRVSFQGDFSNVKKDFAPGNVIEFRISDTEFRHYTPSYFSKEEGICEVLFYLHDKGPGSQWAAALEKGDQLKMIGPGGKVSFGKSAKLHIVYGDETSLGLMECIFNKAKRINQKCVCIIEMDNNHHSWISLINLDSVISVRQETNVISEINKHIKHAGVITDEAAFYLTGNAKAIQFFRNNLLKSGFYNKQIQTEPYWAEGKVGL